MIGSVNKGFLDEISARYGDNRPGPDGRIAYLRHGDTLHVVSIDRLAVPWWICAGAVPLSHRVCAVTVSRRFSLPEQFYQPRRGHKTSRLLDSETRTKRLASPSNRS